MLAWIHTVEVYKALDIVRHDEIKRILSLCSGFNGVCFRICRWMLNSSLREWRRPALTAWTTWLCLRKTRSSQMWIISSSLTASGSVNARRWRTEPEETATSSPRSRDQNIQMRLGLLQQPLVSQTRLKGIVHFEIKMWYLSAYPKDIQDVGVFFSSVDPILMFLGQTVLVCQSYNGRYRSLSL